MRLLILFFAALVAVSPARATEQRHPDLVAFDEAMQLYAKRFCSIRPSDTPLWFVTVDVVALADANGAVKTSFAGRKSGDCRWHPYADAPRVRWPDTLVIPVPKGDKRPVPLIAFDRGVQMLVAETGRCSNSRRPSGYGRFKGLKVRLIAAVDQDGVLRTQAQHDIRCFWQPLKTTRTH